MMDIEDQKMGMEDVINLMCGMAMSRGCARTVYEYRHDKSCVIKFEGSDTHQNIQEWNLWEAAQKKGESATKWLAPCLFLSQCGRVLIQKRTTPAEEYPDKLPVWLTDNKKFNYGIFNGRFVSHDYGVNNAIVTGLVKKMHEIYWLHE